MNNPPPGATNFGGLHSVSERPCATLRGVLRLRSVPPKFEPLAAPLQINIDSIIMHHYQSPAPHHRSLV